MERKASTPALIEGIVAPEFHEVRREFERNFVERGEHGAACAIYHRGQKVVDLWGGQRCALNSPALDGTHVIPCVLGFQGDGSGCDGRRSQPWPIRVRPSRRPLLA